ncbi:MAG TPA: DUF5693 family protein, partial [Actinopolymorphaceae bacterium]|nr:DUF5693 family protein [Actinopolymorphaceae bacterium]
MNQRLTWVACGIAVVLCLPALLLRVTAEQAPGMVDVAVTDSALSHAVPATRGDAAALDRLHRAGVGAVVIGMESVQDLVDRGDLAVVDVTHGPPPDSPAPKLTDGDGSAVVLRCRRGDQGGGCARVAAAARARFGSGRVSTTPSSASAARYVWIDGARHVADLPVGYDPARLRELRANAMRAVLALPARLPTGRRWLEAEVNRAAAMTSAQTVFALGPLPFLPSAGDRTAFADFLAARHLDLALPDLTSVPGAEAYGRHLPGRVVRSHLMDVGPDSDRQALVVRSHRAEKERGVRLLVLRAPSEPQQSSASLDGLAALASGLTSDLPGGLRTGAPSPMRAVEPGVLADGGAILAALIVVGCAGCVVADLPVRRRRDRCSGARWRAFGRRSVGMVLSQRAVLVGLGAVAIVGAGALATGLSILWQALALVAAVAGASLAVLVACRVEPVGRATSAAHGADVGIGRVITSYVLGVGMATATGLVVAAVGSRSEFLVGLVPFVGVKLLLLAPPVVVALATGAFGPSARRQAVALWRVRTRRPVYVLAGLLVLGVVTYYVVRSGNSGAAPGFELRARDALDEAMYVRPRFKEALLGFPALLLALASRPTALARRVLAVVAA